MWGKWIAKRMDSKYHFLTSINKSRSCRATHIHVLMRKGLQTGKYLLSFVRRQYRLIFHRYYECLHISGILLEE